MKTKTASDELMIKEWRQCLIDHISKRYIVSEKLFGYVKGIQTGIVFLILFSQKNYFSILFF